MNLSIKLNIKKDTFSLHADLEFPLKNITSCFGPSGSGKTTFLRHLAGLEVSDSATIKLGDKIFQNCDFFIATHKRDIGYVAQDPFLFNHLNVEQNINFGIPKSSKKLEPELVQLTKENLGISKLLTKKPSNLSGGERQRVALMRAIMSTPKILLLDEPLSGVGAEQKQQIIPFVKDLCSSQKIPILYVTHSIHEILNYSDQIISFQDGSAKFSKDIEKTLSGLKVPHFDRNAEGTFLNTSVVSVESKFQMIKVKSAMGNLSIIGSDKKVGEKLRLRVLADDISISLSKPADTSIMNTFDGLIQSMVEDSSGMTTLNLNIKNDIIKARITTKSANILKLKINDKVFANIKTVAIIS